MTHQIEERWPAQNINDEHKTIEACQRKRVQMMVFGHTLMACTVRTYSLSGSSKINSKSSP
jgi:hypothetical protein